MGCIAMSIKTRQSAFTLIEVLIALIITSLVVCAGAVLAQGFMRSVAYLTNSVDLDTKSRLAADRISREIRNCLAVQSVSSNSIVLQMDTNLTSYIYYPDRTDRPLVRSIGPGDEETILTGCDYVRFDLFQKNPTTVAYDPNFNYLPAQPTDCKVVQLNWVCSRSLLGFKANTTVMQSGKIMIRKK